jgi:hypothetical protein
MFGMSKDEKFKRTFEKITREMVSLAFEYVNNDDVNVDGVFIIGSNENEFIYYDCFFRINGILLERHKINDTGRQYNVSDEMQLKFIKLANQDLIELIKTFNKFNKESPTLIKLEYYPTSGKFVCNLDYELHYSNKKNKTFNDVVENWFDKLK